MATYNGWANRETWLVNCWLGDYFYDLAYEDKHSDITTLADIIEDHVWTLLDESIESGSMWRDFIDLGCVDWYELAERYVYEGDDDEE